MIQHQLTTKQLAAYTVYLRTEERSEATIEKYQRALRDFYSQLPASGAVTKEVTHGWKCHLHEHGYAVSTINSMLAALNGFLVYMGWPECRVKPFKRQRRIFADKCRELSREEYMRLLEAAQRQGNERLMLVMQAICSTGIRVSELKHITVEAVCEGRAEVFCKAKLRTIFIPRKLQKILIRYAKKHNIKAGPVFVSRSGQPLDRSNIWSDMKRLCKNAAVDPQKVFPHNLRHLFAKTFYELDKDIAKLADLLGHASIETTRIYIMECGEEHLRRMEKMKLIL